MAMQLRRPILVGGLGLTVGLWALDGLGSTVGDLGGNLVWAIALGSGIWWLRHRSAPKVPPQRLPATADRTAVEASLTAVEPLLQTLADTAQTCGADPITAIASFQAELAQLRQHLDRTTLSLAVVGEASVGKTAIAQWLRSHLPALGDQSGGITAITVDELPAAALSDNDATLAADVLLLVIAGDITEPEYQTVTQTVQRGQRLVLVFNKLDQYRQEERSLLVQQVQQRVAEYLPAADVVAVAAVPAPIKVRQHQADGSVQEYFEQPEPTMAALAQPLPLLVTQGRSLILGTVLRQSRALQRQITVAVNQYRRQQALPLIEQSQWIAAAAAFANPVPSLDLLATAAVNAQLVMDLGKIYQQPFSPEQAKGIAGTMATLMVQMGVVELSTQAIAPLLKSNMVTFAAGGALQGIGAAYLTRLAGLSLVNYFQHHSLTQGDRSPSFNAEHLKPRLAAMFQQMQSLGMVRSLVEQGIQRLTPTATV